VAAAGKAFTIDFDNKDAASATGPHNIAIFKDSSDLTHPLFTGDPVNGPATVKYNVDALDAGSYYFHCDFHPTTMSGTLAVVAGAS
jgi:plastocyanin